MRSPARTIIQLILVIGLCFISMEALAGTSPPDPGGDPSGGGPPVGGGAPIGNGTFILISASLVYIFYKLQKFRKKIKEIEE